MSDIKKGEPMRYELDPCEQCAAKDKEIQALSSRVKELEAENERLHEHMLGLERNHQEEQSALSSQVAVLLGALEDLMYQYTRMKSPVGDLYYMNAEKAIASLQSPTDGGALRPRGQSAPHNP